MDMDVDSDTDMDRCWCITFLLLPVCIDPTGFYLPHTGRVHGALRRSSLSFDLILESMLSPRIITLDPNSMSYSVLLVSESKACPGSEFPVVLRRSVWRFADILTSNPPPWVRKPDLEFEHLLGQFNSF